MAYIVNYGTAFPTASYTTNSIGYNFTDLGTATNIPTSAGTANIRSLSLSLGVWLVLASLTFNPKQNSNGVPHKLSLSGTAGTIDASFCFTAATNVSNNASMNVSLQVKRVFVISTSSTNNVNLVFQVGNPGENSASGSYAIQYIRIA